MKTKIQSRMVARRGDEAVAEAMRQINPDVVTAFPITPQTEIVQAFNQFVVNGDVDTEYVAVESEHASLSGCVAAAACGARAHTATSSCGLALMHEMLSVTSGMRLPVVMHVVNRAVSSPINIHCDYSDSMPARDAGWIQIYAGTLQEAYDNAIQAVRIAEHPDVLLPVMTCMDGFILGHSFEPLEILPDEAVRKFAGTYKPEHSLLDVENPAAFGCIAFHEHYYEFKRQQIDAMEKARDVILEVGTEYCDLTGRYYGLTESYNLEDADYAIVAMGSVCGTIKKVVNEMRADGEKVGLLRIRSFRPFPYQEIATALRHKKAVAVLDRSLSFGAQVHQLQIETGYALFTHGSKVKIANYVYGIGGREFFPNEVEQIFRDLKKPDRIGSEKNMVHYLSVKE